MATVRTLMAIAPALLFPVLPASAQVRTAGRSLPPGWAPPVRSSLDALSDLYPLADRESAMATALAIQDILRRVPVLANPRGFELQGVVRWRPEQASAVRTMLFNWEYRLRFFSPTIEESDPLSTIVVTVNPYPGLLTGLKSPMSRDSEEPDGMIWEELPRNAVQPGMPPGTVVYQRLVADTPSLTQVLLVPPGESPMIPVSRERFLNAEIARYAPADSEVVRALSETAWERWVADSPRRKELRDGTVARLARTDPEAAAKLKATLEEAERDAGTRLKAMEAGEREWKDRVAAEPTIRQTLISRLESMSPAERALPAVLALEGPWVLVPPGTPDGRRLVALNPAFYRSRGNVTAVRAIGVCFEQSAPNDHHNSTGVYRAVWQVYRTLDWGALARLIER